LTSVTLLAILACNAIAIPLATSFTASELRHIINLSQTSVLLASDILSLKAKEMLSEGLTCFPSLHGVEGISSGSQENETSHLDVLSTAEAGIMLFTSGTTGKPKGVMLSEAALGAQAQSLIQAWNYSTSDRLLHVLPLHYIHDIVNAILAPLLAGSCTEFMYPFNADTVWKRLAEPFLEDTNAVNDKLKPTYRCRSPPITFFTAVPTIWSRPSHGILHESATQYADLDAHVSVFRCRSPLLSPVLEAHSVR
jgi:malonyl-CoA/methylmalonyl-CoA synthetase